MSLVSCIKSNIHLIEEWNRLNGQIIRLGINPQTALNHLDIYKKVQAAVDDNYTVTEACKIVHEKFFSNYESYMYLRKIYYKMK